jgi:hypothetical protein
MYENSYEEVIRKDRESFVRLDTTTSDKVFFLYLTSHSRKTSFDSCPLVVPYLLVYNIPVCIRVSVYPITSSPHHSSLIAAYDE